MHSKHYFYRCDRRTENTIHTIRNSVTDNGTYFVSAETEAFFTSNGIKHLTSAHCHPASNGLAERALQIVKKGLKKITHGTMHTRVLLTYCLTL